MDKNSPAPGQNKPTGQPAGPAPAQPTGQPTGQSPQQPAPTQGQPAGNKPPTQDPHADLKTKLRFDFTNVFNSEADFNVAKVYSICSQGFRFHFVRSKGLIHCKVLLISKKTGLYKPEFLVSDLKLNLKECVVLNNITKKPYLTIKQNDKTQHWDVTNHENGNTFAGSVRVAQNNEIRSVIYTQGGQETARIEFKCPIQKTGICSSAKPANLNGIGLNGKFRSVTLEENPNGELCQNDLEINALYPNNPDQNEFIALVSLLHVMARELQ